MKRGQTNQNVKTILRVLTDIDELESKIFDYVQNIARTKFLYNELRSEVIGYTLSNKIRPAIKFMRDFNLKETLLFLTFEEYELFKSI